MKQRRIRHPASSLRLALFGLTVPPALALAAFSPPAAASPASVSRGRRLAEAHCAACHTIAGRNTSPNPGAPPFAQLQQAYPGRSIEEIFADAMEPGHPPMPSFFGSSDQMQALLDYIRSIQPASPPR